MVADKEFLSGGHGQGENLRRSSQQCPIWEELTAEDLEQDLWLAKVSSRGFRPFFSDESGAGFDYVHASVFAVDGQLDKPSAVARPMVLEVNKALRLAVSLSSATQQF